MTHTYIPALDSGTLLPEINDEEEIETSLIQLKTDLNTVSNQVKNFKQMNALTPDQETQHEIAIALLQSQLNAATRKLEQHSDKFKRYQR